MKRRQKVKQLKKRLKEYLLRKGIYGKHHDLGIAIVSSTQSIRGVRTHEKLQVGDIVQERQYMQFGDVFLVAVHPLHKDYMLNLSMHHTQWSIPKNNLITI